MYFHLNGTLYKKKVRICKIFKISSKISNLFMSFYILALLKHPLLIKHVYVLDT